MKRPWRRWLRWLVYTLGALYVAAILLLALFRFVDPPFTMLQAQRRFESWFTKGEYRKRIEPIPLSRISPHLAHAVIAAEDGRFYSHWGFDWQQIAEVIDDLEEGKVRGASTITQQLVKNLFFGTRGSAFRKAGEALLTPWAELLLGKRRILEIYLNHIEWGPGVYGAGAAARFHYGVSAAQIGREQASRLAAVIPSPRRRRPARMDRYSAIIQGRMSQLGW